MAVTASLPQFSLPLHRATHLDGGSGRDQCMYIGPISVDDTPSISVACPRLGLRVFHASDLAHPAAVVPLCGSPAIVRMVQQGAEAGLDHPRRWLMVSCTNGACHLMRFQARSNTTASQVTGTGANTPIAHPQSPSLLAGTLLTVPGDETSSVRSFESSSTLTSSVTRTKSVPVSFEKVRQTSVPTLSLEHEEDGEGDTRTPPVASGALVCVEHRVVDLVRNTVDIIGFGMPASINSDGLLQDGSQLGIVSVTSSGTLYTHTVTCQRRPPHQHTHRPPPQSPITVPSSSPYASREMSPRQASAQFPLTRSLPADLNGGDAPLSAEFNAELPMVQKRASRWRLLSSGSRSRTREDLSVSDVSEVLATHESFLADTNIVEASGPDPTDATMIWTSAPKGTGPPGDVQHSSNLLHATSVVELRSQFRLVMSHMGGGKDEDLSPRLHKELLIGRREGGVSLLRLAFVPRNLPEGTASRSRKGNAWSVNFKVCDTDMSEGDREPLEGPDADTVWCCVDPGRVSQDGRDYRAWAVSSDVGVFKVFESEYTGGMISNTACSFSHVLEDTVIRCDAVQGPRFVVTCCTGLTYLFDMSGNARCFRPPLGRILAAGAGLWSASPNPDANPDASGHDSAFALEETHHPGSTNVSTEAVGYGSGTDLHSHAAHAPQTWLGYLSAGESSTVALHMCGPLAPELGLDVYARRAGVVARLRERMSGTPRDVQRDVLRFLASGASAWTSETTEPNNTQ